MATTALDESATDETLAERIARRDRPDGSMASARSAFEQLYRRHAPSLLAYLFARVGHEEAEDLHQYTWLRAWESLPVKKPGSFKGWLFEISRNAMIDRARKKRPGPFGDGQADALVDVRQGSPDLALADRERSEALESCLKLLSDRKVAVVRARLSGEDYRAIASSLEIAVEQAQRLYYKAKEFLKSCVERALS
jgi:RNA polymerase sigma factor (sigma-70 family)